MRSTPRASATVTIGGKPFGHGGDGEADRAEEHLEGRPRREPGRARTRGARRRDTPRRGAARTRVELALQRRPLRGGVLEQPRDATDLGIHAGGVRLRRSPRPAAMLVPMKTRFARSAREASAATGRVASRRAADSPVRGASIVRSAETSIRRASAATRSPASSTTRSPRTISAGGNARASYRPARRGPAAPSCWRARRSLARRGTPG